MTRPRATSRVAVLPTTLLAAGLALVLAGCGGSSGDSSSTPTSPSTTPTSASPSPSGGTSPKAAAVIVIKNFAYSGASKVGPGTTVTVRNDDSEAHTVTADSGSAFQVTIQPGKTATFTAPTKAGTYAYHCDFHANMAGTLTVS